MAEGRMLKKEIANSKKLSNCRSERPRVLYFMMLPHLDIKGRLLADPKIIKGQITTMLPYSAQAIQAGLEELHRVGLIVLYHINDEQYLQYARFEDFQSLNPEREAKSKISPPTPDDSRELQRTPLKLSKVKLSKDNTIVVVFEKWNFYKGEKWKSHKTLSYEIELAITEQLKHYSVDELCAAIENYAKVLLNNDFKWSYPWTLQQLLTRTSPTNRKEYQLWRFLPNNYHDEDYLTKPAVKRRIKERKEYFEFIRDCEEDKLIEAYKANKKNLNWLIDEVRPEIKDKAK